MLQTRYALAPRSYEAGGGEKLVETAGYIPAEIQIRQMIDAGIRLGEYRQELYDIANGEDDPEVIPIDVTRSGNYDLADASTDIRRVEARLTKKKEEEKVEEKKEEKVEEKKEK